MRVNDLRSNLELRLRSFRPHQRLLVFISRLHCRRRWGRGLGRRWFFEDEAALFLFCGWEAGAFFGGAARAEHSAAIFGFFAPNFYLRCWSESSSIRVEIHPYSTRLSSVTRTRTSLSSSGEAKAA